MTAAFLTPAVLGNQTATAGSIFRGMSRTHQVTTHNPPVTEGLHPAKNASPGFPTADATRASLKQAYLKQVAHQKTVALKGLHPTVENASPGFPTADATRAYLKRAELQQIVALVDFDLANRALEDSQQDLNQSQQAPGGAFTPSERDIRDMRDRKNRDISQLDRELNRRLERRWGRWFEKIGDWIYQKLWRSHFKGAVSYPSTAEALQKFYDGTSNWALMSGKDKTDGQWKWLTFVKFGDKKVWVLPAQGEYRGFSWVTNVTNGKQDNRLPELTSVKLTPYELPLYEFPLEYYDSRLGRENWKTVIANSKKLNP